MMDDYGTMEFFYQHHDGAPAISVRVHPDADLGVTLQAFEQFLLATGYVFRGQLVLAEIPDVDMPQDGTADLN